MIALDDVTYILPIRRTSTPDVKQLSAYVSAIAALGAHVIVVDGSPPDVFAAHRAAFRPPVRHLAVDGNDHGLNGKVRGVRTAMREVINHYVVIADDDVRYDEVTLTAVVQQLDDADIARPQNVFAPRPWHAYLDEGRSLLARVSGGDWPGTLALRMSAWERAGGYDADVLFENLELVRTIVAAGGRERRCDHIFVTRLPPTVRHYLRQRVRQAYDEFARPARLTSQLAIAPLLALSVLRFGMAAIPCFFVAAALLAEVGRRRNGGCAVFPLLSAVLAGTWVCERAVTSWCALCLRVRGGVSYSHGRLITAAHSVATLQRRYHIQRCSRDVTWHDYADGQYG
jgi:hypothetical protein